MLPYLHREPRRCLRVLSVLVRARQIDQQFQGHGRYEAEVYRRHQTAIDHAWAALKQFDRESGRVAKAVYAAYGPPTRLSDAAKACLKIPDDGIPASIEAGVAVAELGPLLAWLECDDLEGDDPIPPRVRLIQKVGYGTLLRNKRILLDYQDTVDSLLGQRLVDVRNALRHLGWDDGLGESAGNAARSQAPLRRTRDGRVWEFASTCHHVGTGNILSLEYRVVERSADSHLLCCFSDAMRGSALEVAAVCEQAVQSACAQGQRPRKGRAVRRNPDSGGAKDSSMTSHGNSARNGPSNATTRVLPNAELIRNPRGAWVRSP